MAKASGSTRSSKGRGWRNAASRNMPSYMRRVSLGEETWYEGLDGDTRVRVLQEKVSSNKWWNLEVDSQFVRNAEGRAASFETPQEAMNEYLSANGVLQSIRKINRRQKPRKSS